MLYHYLSLLLFRYSLTRYVSIMSNIESTCFDKKSYRCFDFLSMQLLYPSSQSIIKTHWTSDDTTFYFDLHFLESKHKIWLERNKIMKLDLNFQRLHNIIYFTMVCNTKIIIKALWNIIN